MTAPASVPVALLSCGPTGTVVGVNPRAERLFNRPIDGETLDGLLEPGALAWLRRGGTFRTTLRRADGTPVTVDAEAEPLPGGGWTVAVVPLFGARLLDESDRFMDRAFEQMPVGMALFNTDGEYVRVNRALCRLLGRDAATLLGRRDQELTHPDDRAADLDGADRILSGELDTWVCEKRFLRPDGSEVWALANLFFLRDAAGNPLCWFGQFQDITSRKRSENELRHVADHDPLTGVPNRRRLLADLELRLAEAQRHDHSGAVMVLDLDGFKEVNDSLGHIAGDHVLVAIADALRGRLRSSDTLGRLGGDEFAVVLPHLDASDAPSVAAALLEAVREATPEAVTASCGIALYEPGFAGTADTLLALADRAMYDAKQDGRDLARLAA